MRQCINYFNEVEEQLREDNSLTSKLLSGFEIYPVPEIIFIALYIKISAIVKLLFFSPSNKDVNVCN